MEIKRIFIQTHGFSRSWKELGFDDADLRRLENELLRNPKVGNVIQGTGKMRKMRFAFEHRGKSGGARVIYVDFEVYEKIYLLTAYTKKEKENLSQEECNDLRRLIAVLEKQLEENEK